VFTEINVNELLYICVFGESLLNDAVTIVLYHTLTDMGVIGSEHLNPKDFARASGSFVLVTLGGVVFGILAAAITGLTTKFGSTLNVVQPLICLLFPYMAYLLAEMSVILTLSFLMHNGIYYKLQVSLFGNLGVSVLYTVLVLLSPTSPAQESSFVASS